MFFCERCKIEMYWPESMSRSYGKCEVCDLVAVCYDVPSQYLPPPKRKVNKDGNLGSVQGEDH